MTCDIRSASCHLYEHWTDGNTRQKVHEGILEECKHDVILHPIFVLRTLICRLWIKNDDYDKFNRTVLIPTVVFIWFFSKDIDVP